jgi:hypothetical protein
MLCQKAFSFLKELFACCISNSERGEGEVVHCWAKATSEKMNEGSAKRLIRVLVFLTCACIDAASMDPCIPPSPAVLPNPCVAPNDPCCVLPNPGVLTPFFSCLWWV